jgi:ribonuclease BN (tRNA processing enzyme)
MSVKFCVLGSGSQGNAALLMSSRLHVLIDAGFPPDELSARMDGTGASWKTIDALVLTHTHADHIKRKCLRFCAEHEVEFICHERHALQLGESRFFKRLSQAGRVRTYDGNLFEIRGEKDTGDVIRFHPIPLPHDSPPTFGFRIEALRQVPPRATNGAAEPAAAYSNGNGANHTEITDSWVRLGYLADLGRLSDEIAEAMADVDLLALEFNHDEQLERKSGRHPRLINRVMGGEGHLSNRNAAELFRRIVESGANGGPKSLIQLHLSQDCNRADLAYQAAQEVVLLSGAQTRVFSTRQHQRGTVHEIT